MGLVLRLSFCNIYYSKSKESEVSQQRAEYEQLQKQLQQRLLQVEELAMEKQRMLSEKEDSLRSGTGMQILKNQWLLMNMFVMDGLIVYECIMELLIALNLFLLFYCSKYNNAKAEY